MKVVEFNNADDDFATNVKTIKECIKGPTIVLAWAQWCPHCIMMKEEWQTLKNATHKKINIIEIESTNLNKIQEADRALFGKLYEDPTRVYYPMIKTFKNNKAKPYNDERTYDKMKKHVDATFKKTTSDEKKTTKNIKAIKPKSQQGGDVNKKSVIEFKKEFDRYVRNALKKLE